MASTAKFENREFDKQRVENSLGLPEFGDATTEFWGLRDYGFIPLALGYDRIVYGDHGPYVEFSPEHICWTSFPIFDDRPEGCYFDDCYTEDCLTKLYYQKRTVKNKPNPPKGDWAVQNNCKEGYANYVIGKLYLAAEADAIAVCCSRIKPRRKRAGRGKKGGLEDDGSVLASTTTGGDEASDPTVQDEGEEGKDKHADGEVEAESAKKDEAWKDSSWYGTAWSKASWDGHHDQGADWREGGGGGWTGWVEHSGWQESSGGNWEASSWQDNAWPALGSSSGRPRWTPKKQDNNTVETTNAAEDSAAPEGASNANAPEVAPAAVEGVEWPALGR